MTKWADYLISAVKYDSKRRIVQVLQHKDTGEEIGSGEAVDRDVLRKNLKKGVQYSTIFNGKDSWKVGDKVNLIKAQGDYSIRTDSNQVEFDNLKLLPELE